MRRICLPSGFANVFRHGTFLSVFRSILLASCRLLWYDIYAANGAYFFKMISAVIRERAANRVYFFLRTAFGLYEQSGDTPFFFCGEGMAAKGDCSVQKLYKEYLFTRHVLVNDEGPEEKPFETALALASLLSIRVTKGEELVHSHMIRFAQEQLGVSVPEPFYRGFPQSVRELTADQKLFDQCVHYAVTYGFGNFSAPGHSLLEETLERAAFREDAETRRFEAVSEETAVQLIRDAVRDLAASTRALDEKKF